MFDWVKQWFVEPTTDGALGTLSKCVCKLDTVVKVHKTKAEAREQESNRLREKAASNWSEAGRAGKVRDNLSKLLGE